MSKHPGIYEIKTKTGTRYQVKWRRLDGTQAAKNFHKKSEAVNFKRMVEVEKQRGHLPDDRLAKMKFGELATSMVVRKREHKESTKRRRDGIMRNHILPSLGSRAISKIRRDDILRLIDMWIDQGLSANSIKNHLNVLRPIFREATLRDIIVRNPMDGISPPEASEIRRNPLDAHQCQQLLEAINPRYVDIIHFALATGLRWGELENLKMKDFEPFRGLVRVTTSKTKAGVREVTLDREEVVRLTGHIAATGRQAANPESPLLTTPKGSRLNYSNFRRRVFVPACQKAGLHEVTIHDLRRTHGTMLVAERHDVKVVQERMGHRSITTTLSFYATATPDGRARAAGAKTRYLKPPSAEGSGEPELLNAI